jgi:putative oxidoreductase
MVGEEVNDAGTRQDAKHPRSAFALILRIVAIVIGALFVYAGVVKVVDPVEFARDIDNYKTLPWQVSVWLALFLPWLEILCGLALITRVLYRGGVFILTTLMFVFLIATIAARARGLDISCGCFGHASKYLSFAWHLALDFLLCGGLLLLWKRPLPVS